MARIREAKGNPHSNYHLLFGDPNLAYLMSKIHSAMISTGNQLGSVLGAVIPPDKMTTLEDIKAGNAQHNLEVVARPLGKRYTDYAIFKHTQSQIYVVKLISAQQYDLVKGPLIRSRNEDVLSQLLRETGYSFGYPIICGFFADEVDEVLRCMLDPDLDENLVWTGRDFCKFLGIEYDDVLKHIARDQEDNREYVRDAFGMIHAGMSILPQEDD